MNFDNSTIWIIGGFVVILVAILVSYRLKIGFNQNGLEIQSRKRENTDSKINKIKVKGSENEIKQDKGISTQEKSQKNNEIDLDGDKNKFEQDVK